MYSVIREENKLNGQKVIPSSQNGQILPIFAHLAQKQNGFNDLVRCKTQTIKMNHGHLRHAHNNIILITVPESYYHTRRYELYLYTRTMCP